MNLESGMKFRDLGKKLREIIKISEIKVKYRTENGNEDWMDKDQLLAYLNTYPERIV
mgnify:FL=1